MRLWRSLLFAVVGGLVLAVFVGILRYDVAFSTALVAFGTLLLAVVTAWTIDASRQRERRRIEEDRGVREEQRLLDFKRRCLEDIRDWAKSGAVLLTELHPTWDSPERTRNIARLAPLRSENNWMMNASREFDDKQLPKLVDDAAEQLKTYVQRLKQEDKAVPVIQMHERCHDSFVKVLEHVANLRVRLQL